MTKKTCKKCGYQQNLRDDRKAKHRWRCADCGFYNKLAILASFAILMFLPGIVYAEEVPLPLADPYDDTWCTFLAFDERVRFTCNWDWLLPDYVIAEINQTDIPARISDMPQHNLDLADKIRLLLEQGVQPDDPIDVTIPERPPEVPLTIEQKQIQTALDKLDECRTGSGAWAAFMEQGAIEFYVNQSRWLLGTGQTGYEQHQLLKIAMAIEECRIMDKGARAGTVSIAHLHAYMADVLGVDYLGRPTNPPFGETDFTDRMVHTDPVTAKDKVKAIEEAEKYLREEAPWMDPTLGCIPTEDDPDRCLNRGSQPAGLKCQTVGQPAPIGVYATKVCPLDSYNQSILDNPPQTYEDTLQSLCDYYLDTYQHKRGSDEFPKWLDHCPIEDEE